ncbi:MAG: adenylate kinase [Lentisphaerae bacterium]|jgi:adenylate kinase|nr:adenylate kinase [Lentisphaerota bacterium]MBQ9803347.1 adenylate kinase [Lentisphaeria bacterium]
MLTKKNLIFLGGPGAGKGTVSNRMIAKYGVAHISTGDILRAEVAKGTPAGKEAGAIMKSGGLVPDALVCGMVGERLQQPDCEKGFILDGFPRTIAQADTLAETLKGMGKKIDAVVYLNVADEIILERLTARMNCRGCEAIYNKIFMPPKVAGVCDKCGSELFQRPDDSLETAKSRLAVFHKQTQPLIEYYEKLGLLYTCKSTDLDEIIAELAQVLE